MKPAPFEYLAAHSPDEVVDALSDGATQVLWVQGGGSWNGPVAI